MTSRTFVWTLIALLAFCVGAETARAQIGSEPDSDIERCLLEGKIVKGKEKAVGVTKPIPVEIECDGRTRKALFKNIDEHRRGITKLQGGNVEMNFSDDFRYERAAYLLDRQLGMNMIPVAVGRKYKGDDGALVDWVENASHESEIKTQRTTPQMLALGRQKDVMYLFDALILNVDRRPPNWMVDNDDWSLYLIDHSRSFRDAKDLPQEYADRRARLSQDLYDRLQALDKDALIEQMSKLITPSQVKSLLARRDLIIEKIDSERQEFGDDIILVD